MAMSSISPALRTAFILFQHQLSARRTRPGTMTSFRIVRVRNMCVEKSYRVRSLLRRRRKTAVSKASQESILDRVLAGARKSVSPGAVLDIYNSSRLWCYPYRHHTNFYTPISDIVRLYGEIASQNPCMYIYASTQTDALILNTQAKCVLDFWENSSLAVLQRSSVSQRVLTTSTKTGTRGITQERKIILPIRKSYDECHC